MSIKFVDLGRQYAAIKPEIDAAMADVLERSSFILGAPLEKFETEFARYIGVRYCVGVANGTDALELALRAGGIGTGDEVILPANTYFATALAVSRTGATPVLVDVEETTMNLDVSAIEAAITARTKALIPVHLTGRAADMTAVLAIARKHGLFLLEDACQAHGARTLGKRVGSIGDAAAFSFFPGKNLGAYGDAGAVVTDDAAIYERLLRLRNLGQREKGKHELIGANSRLDSLQAAVLSVKLRHLDEWNEGRRRAARRYSERFAGSPVVTPPPDRDGDWVCHLYVVRVADRANVAAALSARGIEWGIHYPTPIHRQPAYADLAGRFGPMPVSDRLAPEILSLPMFGDITDEEVDSVAETVLDAVAVLR